MDFKRGRNSAGRYLTWRLLTILPTWFLTIMLAARLITRCAVAIVISIATRLPVIARTIGFNINRRRADGIARGVRRVGRNDGAGAQAAK
jgi:hypothetical protein